MAAGRGGRLRRDGTTVLVYAQVSVFSYFLYAFAPSVTLLRDQERVRDAVAGLHGTVYAAGVVGAGLVAQRVVTALGRPKAMWLSLAVLCAGVAAYASVPALPLTLTGALICGAGGAGVTIIASPSLLARHGPAGPAAVTEANGIAATVGVLAPLALGASVALGIGWQPAVLLSIVLTAALYALRPLLRDRVAPVDRAGAVPPRVPDGVATVPAPRRAGPVAAAAPEPRAAAVGPLGRQFWMSCVIVVACVGLEFCMTLWSAQLLRDRAGLSPAVAATGVTAILAGMSAGRLAAARVAAHRPVDAMLGTAFAVTALGFTVFWTSTTGWLSFTGLAVCGLGMSLHYPLGVARAIRAAQHPDLASARVATGTGLAIGAAPFVLGLLADLAGVRAAFLLVPALLVIASATLWVAARRARRDVHPAAVRPVAGSVDSYAGRSFGSAPGA